MNFKNLSLILGVALMAACGSTPATDTATDTARFSTYIESDFSLQVPEDWEVITDFPSDFPDETQVVFRNPQKDRDFVANVTVVEEENEKTLTNGDFSQSKLSAHNDALADYDLLSQESITLLLKGNDSETFLNTFKGRTVTSGPELNYMQTYLTRGDTAWVITATYEDSEDSFVIDRMATMLKSFALR